jgi:hypothetical protein
MQRDKFESRIKPVLLWMGTIVASVMAIAYIITVLVLIEGFKVETLLNTTIFSIVTALIGFCIMQMLKIQGQSFAENIEENQAISKEYHQTKTKDKKARSMRFYWLTSGIKDIVVRCASLALTTVGIIYIMIEGNGDYNLLLLAAVNLLMFAGFGLISLVKTYDFYNDYFVPYMLEKIQEVKDAKRKEEERLEKESLENIQREAAEREETIKAEVEKRLAQMVALDENRSTDKGNVVLATNSGTDILESSDSNNNSSTVGESLVLGCSDINNSLLGGTVYTSNGTSDSVGIPIETDLQG